MVSERDSGLIPLRREFDQVWHGFDRGQVRQYLDHVEAHLRRVMSERDGSMAQSATLSRELENARGEILRLRNRVEELRKPPERLEDLDERMKRTADLANSRAEEIVNRAQVAAEKHWAESTEVSTKLRERYQKLIADLDTNAEALHAEHQAALEATQNEVRQLTVEAARRREQLDAEAERRRRNIEREFEQSMTAQKAALEKYVADHRQASKNQAERRIAEATAEAKRRLDEATSEAKRRLDQAVAEADRRTADADEQVSKLARMREQAKTRLLKAEEVLSRSEAALAPLKDESVVSEPLPAVKDYSGEETTPATRPATTSPSPSPSPRDTKEPEPAKR
jgi:colicin import membrane protein